MATKKKAILLRIPPDLWEDLNYWARDELRSVNAQVEYVLREALRKRARLRPTDQGPSSPDSSDASA
ncbi:MAG: Arc family DNA binding domain-containing protein [Planctomycetes bacterium]|nr:Arc family DNA binding domain-containing protein [Planctomycetota bacterium]